jgi:hypothetical protein
MLLLLYGFLSKVGDISTYILLVNLIRLYSVHSCCKSWGTWRSRWLFVKDTFVGYMRPDTGEVGCVLLMDQDFKVMSGSYQTGSSHGVIISNLSRTMLFKDWTKRKAQEWVDAIQDTANNTGNTDRLNAFEPF